jgi:hypothetical protein
MSLWSVLVPTFGANTENEASTETQKQHDSKNLHIKVKSLWNIYEMLREMQGVKCVVADEMWKETKESVCDFIKRKH